MRVLLPILLSFTNQYLIKITTRNDCIKIEHNKFHQQIQVFFSMESIKTKSKEYDRNLKQIHYHPQGPLSKEFQQIFEVRECNRVKIYILSKNSVFFHSNVGETQVFRKEIADEDAKKIEWTQKLVKKMDDFQMVFTFSSIKAG